MGKAKDAEKKDQGRAVWLDAEAYEAAEELFMTACGAAEPWESITMASVVKRCIILEHVRRTRKANKNDQNAKARQD
jgi:hypothetical protein